MGERAGVHVFAPEPGNGVGDPVQVARKALEHAERSLYDVVVIDTAGRLGIDEVLMQQAADIKATTRPDEVLFVVDAMIGQDARQHRQGLQRGHRLRRSGPHKTRRRRPGRCSPVHRPGHRQTHHVRVER